MYVHSLQVFLSLPATFKQESEWLALVNRLVSAGLSHYQPVSEQLWAHLYCRADQIVSVCFRLEDTMPAELINFFPFFVLPVSRVYGEGNLQIDLIHNTTPGHNKKLPLLWSISSSVPGISKNSI